MYFERTHSVIKVDDKNEIYLLVDSICTMLNRQSDYQDHCGMNVSVMLCFGRSIRQQNNCLLYELTGRDRSLLINIDRKYF